MPDALVDKSKIYKVSIEYGSSINALREETAFGTGDSVKGEMWITPEALEGLRELHGEVEILEEREILPVFHSPMREIETKKLEGMLSCVAVSEYEDSWQYEEDSVGLLGVCYVGTVQQGFYPQQDLHGFVFGPNDAGYIWLALCNERDISYARSIYPKNEYFERWLAEARARAGVSADDLE